MPAIALLLAALAPAGAAAARDSTTTFRLKPVAERGGVLTFRVGELEAARIRSARVTVGRRGRRLKLAAVRRAIRKGVLRAHGPRGAPRPLRRRARLVIVSAVDDVARIDPRAGRSPRGPNDTRPATRRPPAIGDLGKVLSSVTCSPLFGTFSAADIPRGCFRPYADSSPFNEPIPAGARVDPQSAAIVSRVLGFGRIQHLEAGQADTPDDFGHPTYYSTLLDPLFTVHCVEPWGTCAVEGMTIRIPDAARPAAGSDHHLTVVDQLSGWEYDFWNVRSKPRGGGTLEVSWGGRTQVVAGDGRGSAATAANFGNLAGIIRAPELEEGQIRHALFLVVKCDSGRFVYPATKSGRSCASAGLTNAGAPPMGARFQLAMTDAEIDALPVPAWKKTILRAMAVYGMYFGDTGSGSWAIQAESGSTYTSFGYEDRLVSYARAVGATLYNGRYVFNLRDGVDYAGRLRVIDPCVAQNTCAPSSAPQPDGAPAPDVAPAPDPAPAPAPAPQPQPAAPEPRPGAPAAQPDPGAPEPAAPAPAAPANPATCTRAVVLTDVHVAGSRLLLSGIARVQHARRRVVITSAGRRVASSTVRADGTFAASAASPGRRERGDRYQAAVAGQRSPQVAISRLAIVSQRRAGAGVRVRGRLSAPRPGGRSLSAVRLEGCPPSSTGTAFRARSSAGGEFSVTVPRPAAAGEVAVYRISVGGAAIDALVPVRHDG